MKHGQSVLFFPYCVHKLTWIFVADMWCFLVTCWIWPTVDAATDVLGIPLRPSLFTMHDELLVPGGVSSTALNLDLASFVMDWLCTLESNADLALVVVVVAFTALSNCACDAITVVLGDLCANAFSNLDLASFTGLTLVESVSPLVSKFGCSVPLFNDIVPYSCVNLCSTASSELCM